MVMEKPDDDKVKPHQGDGKERVLHRNVMLPLLNACGNEDMDSQDWNVDFIRGTEDIQSGNSSEIGHTKCRVGGNEDLNGLHSSQKEANEPRCPVTQSMSKGKSYLA